MRNRESAQRARDRQKAKMKWLEEEINRLKARNSVLIQENLILKNVMIDQKIKSSGGIGKFNRNENWEEVGFLVRFFLV